MNAQLFYFMLAGEFLWPQFTLLSYREREDQIQKLSEVQKQQAQQAEHALEDFKSQVERNSGRMFDEMKAQVQGFILTEQYVYVLHWNAPSLYLTIRAIGCPYRLLTSELVLLLLSLREEVKKLPEMYTHVKTVILHGHSFLFGKEINW